MMKMKMLLLMLMMSQWNMYQRQGAVTHNRITVVFECNLILITPHGVLPYRYTVYIVLTLNA